MVRAAERGHVGDELGVLPGWHDGVARRDEETADVAHHDGQDGVIARAAGDVHGHHRVIDAGRGPVHDPGAPRQVRAVHVIAGDPHDPVGRGAEPLDEVGLRTGRDPLEYRARPRVLGPDELPGRSPGQQFLHRPGGSHGVHRDASLSCCRLAGGRLCHPVRRASPLNEPFARPEQPGRKRA
jgi:hypothetical protein